MRGMGIQIICRHTNESSVYGTGRKLMSIREGLLQLFIQTNKITYTNKTGLSSEFLFLYFVSSFKAERTFKALSMEESISKSRGFG